MGPRQRIRCWLHACNGDITGGDGAYELGEFRLWDAGFDFYAPQEFTAEDGRHILIGWMGMPDEPTYGNAPTVVCGCSIA